jgi:cytochrome c-type biogenesis protein CcmE
MVSFIPFYSTNCSDTYLSFTLYFQLQMQIKVHYEKELPDLFKAFLNVREFSI